MIRCLISFMMLSMPVSALAAQGASAPQNVSRLSILFGFVAINSAIIAKAAARKYLAKSPRTREIRPKRPSRSITFTAANDIIEIGYLLDRAREFSEDHELHVKTVFDVCLALEEMLSYVISNGFDAGQRASILVRIDLEKDRANITVEYIGRELNPLQAPKIDMNTAIEDLPLEGWDIHLLRMIVDEIGYERAGEKNIFRVVKKWATTSEPA